jgi:EPS-associated MarR family transcriptional regulator
MNTQSTEDVRFHVLRLIQREPELTQRELADRLGVSLGKANYLLNALIEKGLIKARNFKNSKNKAAYAYILTPDGIDEKARVAVRFLRRKEQEYEELRREIEELGRELNRGTGEAGL